VPGDTAVVFSENPEQVWETLVPPQAPLSAGLRAAGERLAARAR
jgi:hypothetical protein